MFKKLLISLIAGLSLGFAQAQSPVHTPTLEGTYNWTGTDTFPFGNLRLSGSIPQCPTGTVQNGFQTNFAPNCIPTQGSYTAGFNNTVGSGGLTNSATTLTLASSTSGYPTHGCGYIDTEYICYATLDVDGLSLDGLIRGKYNTSAASHSAGALWNSAVVVLAPDTGTANVVILGGINGNPYILTINSPFLTPFNPTPSLVVNQGSNRFGVGQNGIITQENLSTCCNRLDPTEIGVVDTSVHSQDLIFASHNVMQITNQYETQQPIGFGGGIAGGVSFQQPATIAAPDILNGNPTGAITYKYRCQDHAGLVPGTDSTFTASSTPPFPFTIVCPRQSGVVSYDILRTAGGVNQGIVAANVLPGTAFNDNINASATATTIITTNTSQAYIDGLNFLKAGDLYDLNLSVSTSPVCVGAGNKLTQSGCTGGGGSATPASPVGSIQTNADGTNLGALNLTGILKQTATTPGVATGTSNSTSGDYAQPFDVAISGTGLTGSFNSGHLILTGSGAAGSGTVAAGLAHQLAYYPTAGTGVQGTPSNVLPGYFVIDPSMSLANINTLLSTAPTGSTILVLNGTPQFAWSNPNHLRMVDTRTSADYATIYQYGIGCDANQWTVPLTSGSNIVNVGADFGTEAIGRTFSFGGRTGYGFGSEQWAWAPTVVGYSYPNATLSGNAPFSGTFKGTLGTLNTTHIQDALDTSGYAFPLKIPTGCTMLTGPVNINQANSILGQQMARSRFIDLPGQDILVQPPGGHGAGGNGMRWENFAFTMQADVDWSWGYNQYPTNYTSGGVGVTAVPPVYRPTGNLGHEANNPCGDEWVTGCSNGVAATTQNSAVVCVPTALNRTFINGRNIAFPYFATGVFSTTILNQTGGGCPGGTLGLTLNASVPNNAADTVAQAYYVTGSSFQTIQTAIPTTMTYPFTLLLSGACGPTSSSIYNFAPAGHVFIGTVQFDYLGSNYNNTAGACTITLRKGPTTTAGYAIGSQPVIPANPCPAKFNTPPPVIPNLNSGDTTPSGAVDFPGHCVGAAAIAFPQPDGTSPDTGMVNSSLSNLLFETLDVQSTNGVAAIYEAGNTASYGVTYSGLKIAYYQYGLVQGPAAKNNWGVAAVGPTSTGNHLLDWQIHAAYPLILSDFQQTEIGRMDTYTSAINPYDGTPSGSGTCEALLSTVNEQNGSLVTITGQISQHDHNCEPASGGSGVVYAYADIESFGTTIRQENFEAGPTFFGGALMDWSGGYLSAPAFNYGSNNVFKAFSGVGTGAYPTNAWIGTGSNQIFNFGKLSSCSMFYGGQGPLVSCGALWNQSYEGKSMDAAHDGIFAAPPMNILGGQIKPGMWNNNGALDSGPMTVGMVLDPTEPYWGAYTGCNLSGGGSFCQPNHFFGFQGFMWIGPNSPFLSATPYDLEFNVKTAAASGSFTIQIQAFDSGNGLCASSGTVASGAFSTTTSWAHKHLRVDLTGRTGCYFSPQFFLSSTTDQYRIGEFDMVPLPGFVRAPNVSDTIEGVSCGSLPNNPSPGSYLGNSALYAYFCNSAGTVVRSPIS